MNLQDEIKKLNEKEKKIVAVLSGWSILHLILLLISDGSTRDFWPFDEGPVMKYQYDFSEFTVYGLIPWVVFIIYRILNNPKNN